MKAKNINKMAKNFQLIHFLMQPIWLIYLGQVKNYEENKGGEEKGNF